MNKKFFTFATFSILTLLSQATFAQYDNDWALGFRVGEPLGINIRKYFQSGEKAFDVNVGTYGFIYGKNRSYNKGDYRSSGVMLQGIYLWNKNLLRKDVAHLYYGLGGQINSRNHYSQNLANQPVNYDRKLSLGPTATAGLEYSIPNNNLAAFLDGGVYCEALPAPFFINWQVSGGVRLNLSRVNRSY